MTLFQLLMLGASAFFAYKIYEHINSLKDEDVAKNRNEKPQKSEESVRSAEAFSTFDATALIKKADEALEDNNLDKALAIYSEANIKAPNNDETLFKMGYTLFKQERYEEAIEYFEEALALDENNPFTYMYMGLSYQKEGKKEEAMRFLEKALALEPELDDAKEALEKLQEEV